MKQTLSFSAAIALTFLVSTQLFAETLAAPGLVQTVRVQKRTMSLLLKIRHVKYIATAMCDEQTGALITDFKNLSSTIDCIAVRMNGTSDVTAVEMIFENPLNQSGVLIHFTALDPIPGNKGGITIHN